MDENKAWRLVSVLSDRKILSPRFGDDPQSAVHGFANLIYDFTFSLWAIAPQFSIFETKKRPSGPPANILPSRPSPKAKKAVMRR